MRDLSNYDDFRVRTDDVLARYGWFGDGTCGVFMFPHPATGVNLQVVASSANGWDHVSVSLRNRCPNWAEMSFIKHKFFQDDEAAMQLHVSASDHINIHPNCLHLWRPHEVAIPLPPTEFV